MIQKKLTAIIAILATLVSLSAMADQTQPAPAATEDKTVLACVVPVQSGPAQVTIDVTLGADLSQDYVMLTIKDSKNTTNELTYFAQMEKGQMEKNLSQGGASFLLLSEETKQEAGVIKNTGFFAASVREDNSFGGFIAAAGNIYPISCQKK